MRLRHRREFEARIAQYLFGAAAHLLAVLQRTRWVVSDLFRSGLVRRILRGKLELWVDGKMFLLEAGDSFGFPSTLAHRYLNPDTEEAEVIWAITPPSY